MTHARIPYVVPGSHPALAAVEGAIRAGRGEISPLYRALLNSPAIAQGWEAMLTAVRNNARLEAAVRELVILRVAMLNGAGYEFRVHTPHARKAGVSDQAIDDLRAMRMPAGLSRAQALALELADAMTREITVADALMRQLQDCFEPQLLVELVATVAAYNMVSRFLVAFQIDENAA